MMEKVYPKTERLGVIFWDMNGLKKINDTMGHEYGDFAISAIAASIMENLPGDTRAYRIGGDEFVMIMRGADEKVVAKKIRDWKQILKALKGNSEYEISVSVGYAYGEGKDLDAIIHEADQRMYENKRLIHEEKDKATRQDVL